MARKQTRDGSGRLREDSPEPGQTDGGRDEGRTAQEGIGKGRGKGRNTPEAISEQEGGGRTALDIL